MSDRQEIAITTELSAEDLYQIMVDHWDTKKYNEFVLDKRNALSEELGIFLPATDRFRVLVEPVVEGVFHKEPKVVLSVVETPKGMEEMLRRSFPTMTPFLGAVKIGRLFSIEKERERTEETILMEYAAHLREILKLYKLCAT